MRPEDHTDNRRSGGPLIPQRTLLHGGTTPTRDSSASNQAAVNIARQQLGSIYNGSTSTPTPQTTPVASAGTPEAKPDATGAVNPYKQTHGSVATAQPDQWKKYHSAWQEYYQQYYERYYMGQVHQARQALEQQIAAQQPDTTPHEAAKERAAPTADEVFSRDEALYDLRSKLMSRLRSSAKKARKSRHFVPITAAVCVMVVFLFLQYNRVLFANVQAYISPGNIDPANIIVNPSTDVAVSPDPKLIIPKINVDVPVNYDTTPDYDSQMKAMENGVAWFGISGADSHPGQIGNTVLSGHSSNDIIDKGDYKFIFARLDQLASGDTIYVNYQGKRYSYTVTKKEVVKPTDVQKLVYKTDKPILTLITCTPLGTSTNRLLVTAEQVSPDPKAATAAPADSGNTSGGTSIPGNSPTFVERLFGN